MVVGLKDKYMNKTDFFEKYGSLLVKSTFDDSEFGDYLFTYPEDIDKVLEYNNEQHQIVSVHELYEQDDYIDMTIPCDFGYQPYKYGYYVLRKP